MTTDQIYGAVYVQRRAIMILCVYEHFFGPALPALFSFMATAQPYKRSRPMPEMPLSVLESGADAMKSPHGNTKHGLCASMEYSVWCAMKKRCYLKNHIGYASYGGKGVTVCARWLESFENFLADMGDRPGYEYSLDRWPAKDGNYEPGNCRWATDFEQARNRSDNVLVPLNGKMVAVSEWADATGGNAHLVYDRMTQQGWSAERAISVPLNATRRGHVASAAVRAIISAKATARHAARRESKLRAAINQKVNQA